MSRPNQTDRQTHHEGLRKFFCRFLASEDSPARERPRALQGPEDRSRSRCSPHFNSESQNESIILKKKDVYQFFFSQVKNDSLPRK